MGLVSYAAGDGRLLRVGQFSAGPDLYLHAADLDLDPDSGIVVAVGSLVFRDDAAVTISYRAVFYRRISNLRRSTLVGGRPPQHPTRGRSGRQSTARDDHRMRVRRFPGILPAQAGQSP